MSDCEEINAEEIDFGEPEPEPEPEPVKPQKQKQKPKEKVDKRSIQSKLNAEKARLTKLEKLRKKKAKAKQREIDEAYYSTDSDESDTELLVIKQKKNTKVKKAKAPKQEETNDEDKTDSELRKEINSLKKMIKAMKQQGEGKNTIINVHPSVQPKANSEFKDSILRF